MDKHLVLEKYFGYTAFRPMQEEIIDQVLAGKDALVLMPTGGGKSICFQIPALLLDGVCIVVSPLIALMKDQVEGLIANGVEAAYFNSSLTGAQQAMVENQLVNGQLKLLYVSPEKLLTNVFIQFIQRLKVNLFAIDEAHCISAWGHDFRPEYTQLKVLKEHFSHVPVIALTATADKITRKDIASQLYLQNHKEFVASFDRPNLSLTVLPGRKRIDKIIDFIQERPNQSGIIYSLSRKSTEDNAAKLRNSGINAACYHAGLPSSEREKVQEDFIKDSISIICATIAFGMGIDKSNVRWVIHFNLPKNMESYYQEIGRAGRDSLPSDTLLFYSYADVMRLRNFIDDNSQKDLQLAKLGRIQQYAEAKVCRRRILLSYFGENMQQDCGNCDVCKNPPTFFDGTIIAQKALSVVARLKEKVGIGLMIDVLRGSEKTEIMRQGFNKIKTYGAGKDISYEAWQQYIEQLLNLGLIEIAYDDKNIVRLTEASHKVLFQKQKVKLVDASVMLAKYDNVPKEKKKTKEELLQEDLFEHLRKLRKEIADSEGVPPYVVFSDATLTELAKKRPMLLQEMRSVSGIGEQKLRKYGQLFIDTLFQFIVDKTNEGIKIKGATYWVTYHYYKQGLSPETIAQMRKLNIGSIYGHLAHLYQEGYEINIGAVLTEKEIKSISIAVDTVGSESLSEIFNYLEQKIDYGKIKIGLAYMNIH